MASVDGEERVRTSFVGFAVIAAFAPFVVTASAEPYDVAPVVVPDGIFGMAPADILGVVRSSGLHPLSPPIRRGRVYLVRAMDRSGEDVRVVVDAGSGRILLVTPTDAVPGYGPTPGYGQGPAYGPGPGYEPAPRYQSPGPYYYYGPSGPRDQRDYYYGPQDRRFDDSASEPRSNVAPTTRVKPSEPRSADLTPRTPLPRPRPVNASVAGPADATQTVPSQTTSGVSPQGSDQAHSSHEKVEGDKPVEASTAKPPAALPPVTPLD